MSERPTFVLVELKTPFQPSYDAETVHVHGVAYLPPGVDRARFQLEFEALWRRLLSESCERAFRRATYPEGFR